MARLWLLVRVMVEVKVTTTVPARVRVRDQEPISRDCSLASELVQARRTHALTFKLSELKYERERFCEKMQLRKLKFIT